MDFAKRFEATWSRPNNLGTVWGPLRPLFPASVSPILRRPIHKPIIGKMRSTGTCFGPPEKRPAVWRPHNSLWVVPMLAEFWQTYCRKDPGIGGTYDLEVREKAILTSPRIRSRCRHLRVAIHVSEQCP